MARRRDGQQPGRKTSLLPLRVIILATVLVGLAAIHSAGSLTPVIRVAHASSGPTPTNLAVSISVPVNRATSASGSSPRIGSLAKGAEA